MECSIRFPICACYPQVAVRDGAAHVLAIGDVVEPVAAWRDYKKEKSGSAWDYYREPGMAIHPTPEAVYKKRVNQPR